MIDVDDVPTGAVPQRRAEAEKKLLRELTASTASPSVRRRRVLVVGAFAAVALGGASAAAAYTVLAPERATQRDSARCYTQVSSDTGDGFPGTTIAIAQEVGGPPKQDVPPEAVQVCAVLWRQGFLTEAGPTAPPDGGPPSDHPVPELVACVLPSGEAAVFPGDAQTCSELGLPSLGEG